MQPQMGSKNARLTSELTWKSSQASPKNGLKQPLYPKQEIANAISYAIKKAHKIGIYTPLHCGLFSTFKTFLTYIHQNQFSTLNILIFYGIII
jgi:hypothetical protein